jgi:hypothetical protein
MSAIPPKARMSNRPVVTDNETFIGRGSIGGIRFGHILRNRIAALPNDTAVYYSAIYAAGQDSSLILRE